MVVQTYIADPFLVKGFKFDLRIYVMVTGINEGDMQAYTSYAIDIFVEAIRKLKLS